MRVSPAVTQCLSCWFLRLLHSACHVGFSGCYTVLVMLVSPAVTQCLSCSFLWLLHSACHVGFSCCYTLLVMLFCVMIF